MPEVPDRFNFTARARGTASLGSVWRTQCKLHRAREGYSHRYCQVTSEIHTSRKMLAEAERKMGQMLKDTDRAVGTDKGGRQYVDGNRPLPSNTPPTIADLGLTKNESAKAQKLADIPQEKFDEVKAGKTRRICKEPHDT